MTPEPHPALKEIRTELEREIEARGWEFWPLQIQAEVTPDGYQVKLTKNPGVPGTVEVTDTFPQDADPGKVAAVMCDALQEEEK